MTDVAGRLDWCTPFPNDEPTVTDRLGRKALAEELARTALCCETPMVIGLYGGWGSGKTSLMRMIEAELECNRKKFLCKPDIVVPKIRTIV